MSCSAELSTKKVFLTSGPGASDYPTNVLTNMP